jgi:protoporphyrinogen oxidase
MVKKNWGIVGGGIMGMTLAHRLINQGHSVTLIEAAPTLGGLVSSWKMNEVEWDKYYHVILLSDFKTREILKQIGLEKELNWVETKTGFYMNGGLHSMSNTIEFLQFPSLNLFDKFRLGLTILIASKIKNYKKLEQIPVTTWLKKWSGTNTYNKIWLPLLRAKLGESYTRTSAVFIWATIQRLYGARKSGLKKEMFGFVNGGYKKVIEAFGQSLTQDGVTIEVNQPIKAIQNLPNGKVEVIGENKYQQEFDEVIVTLPADMAAKICKGLSLQETALLNGVEYMSVICVAVLLDKPISEFYITNITDDGIPFTGIIEMTALVNPIYLNGKSLVYLPKYVVSTDTLFDKPEDEIKKCFLDHFKKMYPSITDSNIQFAGVAKAKHVTTVAKLGYSNSLPPVITSMPNVSIINTAHIIDGTLNVNETIHIADNKLAEILSK